MNSVKSRIQNKINTQKAAALLQIHTDNKRSEREIKKTIPLSSHQKEYNQEFPGGTVVRTLHFQFQGSDSVLGCGTKIPQSVWHGQKN